MTRETRISEYKDTVNVCNHGYYINLEDDLVQIPEPRFDDSILFDRRFTCDTDSTDDKADFPTVEVVDNDTLTEAQNLVEAGYNVTILNMASSFLPGGGVMKGSGAQEEDIFRRSNLMMYLYRYHPIGKDFGMLVDKDKLFYPINGTYDLIWSPSVSVFKESEKNSFRYLDEPFQVNVITCAALRKPQLTDANRLNEHDTQVMTNKIANMLMCASNTDIKNTALVLGAFGCGAYGNPPEQIAEIFHKEIYACPTITNIDRIHFAIIDSNSVGEKHNPNGNFKPFMEEFSK